MKLALDLDGTLITAEERQSWLLRAVAARYDLQLCPQTVWGLKRAGSSNASVLAALDIEEPLADLIDAAWRAEIESVYWLGLDRPFDDTVPCLRALLDRGYELHLITARRNSCHLQLQLRRLNLPAYFESVTCVDPADAPRQKSRRLMEIDPVGFIGDSESDFSAARQADVEFYAVSTGQRSEALLRSAGVAHVYPSLGELQEIFPAAGE